MKCISLAQPYASMLVAGHKKWETRPYKPGERNLAIIRKEGLLVHASRSKRFDHVINMPPFNKYPMELPRGYIIGIVQLGRILTSDQWRQENGNTKYIPGFEWSPKSPEAIEEKLFGDYDPGRFAWETICRMQLQQPIFVRGALSIWDYNLPQSIKDMWNVI
jgi:hypothetical protein